MLIFFGIYIVASIFELRYLFKQGEKKEAAIYLFIVAMAMGLGVYLALTPIFYSFARMINDLFRTQ